MNDRTLPLGLMYGLANEKYHAMPALGSTGLKRLAKSPRHFIGAEPKTSDALLAGNLAHCAILEPDEVANRFIVRPEGVDLRTKAGKAWAESIPAGLDMVTAEQMAAAKAQRESILALPDIAALLQEGDAEVSAFWIDAATGTPCKCRPDWVAPAGEGVILVDIKTTTDASPKGFARAVVNYGYDIQNAWYADGYALASGLQVLGFVFAAVETDPPYVAAAYMLSDEDLDRARAQCARLLRLHKECADSGQWPGYQSGIQLLNMPAWANKD